MKRRDFIKSGSILMATPFVIKTAFASTSLRIVYSHELAPLSFGTSEKAEGIYVDIINEILSNIPSISLKHSAYPWPRAQKMLETEEADAFFTAKTDARLAYATFANDPGYAQSLTLIYARNHPQRDVFDKVKSLDELDNFTHAQNQGNGWAETNFKGKKIDWSTNQQVSLNKVAKMRNDFTLTGGITAKYTARTSGFFDELVFRDVSFLSGPMSYFGIRRSHPDADKIAAAFGPAYAALIAKGRIAEIEKKYIG